MSKRGAGCRFPRLIALARREEPPAARLRPFERDRTMDAFSYLSVLLSIILGLAITQVLQGFRGLMLARSRLRSYWPSVAWAILLLVLDVQVWWAMYDLRFRHEWSFLGFAAVLAQTVPLYLLAGLGKTGVRVNFSQRAPRESAL